MTRHTARLMLSGVATVTSVFALLTLPSPSPGHLPDEPEMGLADSSQAGAGNINVEVGARPPLSRGEATVAQRVTSQFPSGADLDLAPFRFHRPPVWVDDEAIPERWARLVECEASGRWDANTGNGFSGGIQALPSTWEAFGGLEFAPEAWQARPAEQVIVAERILDGQGWANAWPACSRTLGYR